MGVTQVANLRTQRGLERGHPDGARARSAGILARLSAKRETSLSTLRVLAGRMPALHTLKLLNLPTSSDRICPALTFRLEPERERFRISFLRS
jgi:hypothetical protein